MKITVAELRRIISEISNGPDERKRHAARVGKTVLDRVREAISAIADEGESSPELVAADDAMRTISDLFDDVLARTAV